VGVGLDDPRRVADRDRDLCDRGGVQLRDRRVTFFLLAAVVSFALVPVLDSDLRWVPIVVGATYVLLTIASYFDRRTRDKLPPRFSRGR
jgi:hypothetical protein